MFNKIKESFNNFCTELGYTPVVMKEINRTESSKGSSSAVYNRYDEKYGLHVKPKN